MKIFIISTGFILGVLFLFGALPTAHAGLSKVEVRTLTSAGSYERDVPFVVADKEGNEIFTSETDINGYFDFMVQSSKEYDFTLIWKDGKEVISKYVNPGVNEFKFYAPVSQNTYFAPSPAVASPLPSQNYAPAATVICRDDINSLGRGSRGDGVVALQKDLRALGLLDATNVTGYYGPLTEEALQKAESAGNVRNCPIAVSPLQEPPIISIAQTAGLTSSESAALLTMLKEVTVSLQRAIAFLEGAMQ